MFALGVVTILLLSGLAYGAALAVAIRAELAGRAETAAATGLLWNAIVLAPIYVLGLANRLTATSLGVSSAALSCAVLAALIVGPAPGEAARRLAREALGQLRLPFDALRDTWRARSLAFLGLAASATLIGWTLVTSYYAPSWRQWDALWYHEPIVAFTLQNHGFAMVNLPQDGLQKINGYPRLCEMTQLWFVIFTDRRLIEIANSVLAPLFMLVVYLLVQRQLKDRVASIGWASFMLLVPATSILLASVYVDMETAIFVLGAFHFGVRAPLRLRDVALTAVCLTLAIGAKILALAPVGVVSLVAIARAASAHGRRRPLPTLATVAAGAAVMAAMVSVTYARNWLHFKNPFWPDLIYDNPKYGIHWPGMPGGIEAGFAFDTLVDHMASVPYSRALGHASQVYEYGSISAFFLLPAILLSGTALLARAGLSVIGGLFRRPAWRLDDASIGALYAGFTMVTSLCIAPAPVWSARYYIAHGALGIVLVAWAGGRRGFERLREGTFAVAVVGALMAFYWTPRWWFTPTELLALARTPYPQREVTPAAKISPGLGLASGSPIPLEVGLAREAGLGRGDVLAFDDLDGAFVGLFWNNAYSNRVVYVPSGPDYLARVAQAGASWLYCHGSDPECATLRAPGSAWEEVGALNVEGWGSLFRRRR